jgi:hypothetical protein
MYDFLNNKSNAKRRGVVWNLTYEEWWSLWEQYYHLRGRGKGKYHLCRHGDIGSYNINNCYVAPREQNRQEQSDNQKAYHKTITLQNIITGEIVTFNTVKEASKFLQINDSNFRKYQRNGMLKDWKEI